MTTNDHVSRVGGGPALIFTHGWQNDRHIWDGVIEELKADHECIAWDLPAHGTNPRLPEGADVRSEVLAQLDEIVETVDGTPILIGHSLGGFVSMSYQILNPGKIAALGLVSTGPGFRSEQPREDWNQWVRDNANPDNPGQADLCMQHDSLVIDSLPEMTVPIVSVTGDRDKQYMASVAVFENKLPNVRTVIIADAGHMLHVKRPQDVANELRTLTSNS